jgi:hypothetical protein
MQVAPLKMIMAVIYFHIISQHLSGAAENDYGCDLLPGNITAFEWRGSK